MQPLESDWCTVLHLRVVTILNGVVSSQERSSTFQVWHLHSKWPHLRSAIQYLVCIWTVLPRSVVLIYFTVEFCMIFSHSCIKFLKFLVAFWQQILLSYLSQNMETWHITEINVPTRQFFDINNQTISGNQLCKLLMKNNIRLLMIDFKC